MNATLINNRYRILETLGRGGFGETYLAEDLHMPSGRKCVLKQLKPIVQQPSIPLWMKERFQREAVILEELGVASNQIPELYAYFSEDEQFYLVQEWIAGETLAQKWEREGNLTGEAVKKILIQIIPVLDFIHSRKIVHRDIKPENIIIRDSDRLPILIDFGAVKEAMVTSAEHPSNSMFSAAIGTPGYMPSEQAAGRPVYSSDLYGLGLTAIFLLTGKAPQELELDSQTGEIIWQQYAENVDRQLVGILNKAIRFHPRDRFSEGKEMLQALQPHHSYHKTHGVTGATVKVSPSITAPSERQRDFAHTVAYQEPQSTRKRNKGSWLNKIVLLFLATGGLTVGVLAAGFYTVSSWWQSLNRETPQVEVEQPRPTTPEPVVISPEEETEQPEAKEPEPETIINLKIAELIKKKKEPKDTEKNTPTTEEKPEIPEVVVKPKPEVKPEPKPEIATPILTTGTSESTLVSTLGKPTYERNEPQKNSRVLVYRNTSSNNVNLSYHSDSNGRIKQADVALNQNLSLGAMQDTLGQLLGSNASADAKNKLRNVYNRRASLQSFRSGKLQGTIQRDSKDRVNISVWESGY